MDPQPDHPLQRRDDRYGIPAISLHWGMALLVVGGWFVGQWMTDLPFSPLKLKVYSWHKWNGVLVFVLLFVRLGVRWVQPPPPGEPMPRWQTRLVQAAHVLLYLLLALVPLSGWLYSSAAGFTTVWFGVWPLPDLVPKDAALKVLFRSLHGGLTSALVVVVALHVLAAFKHHVIDRDRVLTRMLPWLKPRQER